jgi:hypothetical protein
MPKLLKKDTKTMTDKDNTSNTPSQNNVVEHPQLKRDRAFALFLARNHARNHGKPLPDPSTISPIGFTRLKPEMSREQMVENLIATLERNGITVKRNKETPKKEMHNDK